MIVVSIMTVAPKTNVKHVMQVNAHMIVVSIMIAATKTHVRH